MAYIGKTPASAALTSSDISDGIIITDKLAANAVVTSKITDGTIATADIANSAITNAKVSSTLITGQTAITGVANDDLVLISDTSGSAALKKMTVANLVANAGGGKILQAVTVTNSTEVTNASTNYATSGIAKAITPSASSSKILVLVGSNFRVAGDGGASNVAREGKVAIFRGSVSGTLLQQQIIGITNIDATTSAGVQSVNSISFAFLDSPSTTNATTYTVGISGLNNGDAQAQPFNFGSSMVLLEVGA